MPNTDPQQIPKGYVKNAAGHLIPRDKVKPGDMAMDKLVKGLVNKAKKTSSALSEFKSLAFDDIQDFLDKAAAEYGVKLGGQGGNVTLVSFDGEYQIKRQVSKSLSFNHHLQTAKSLIDECILVWSKGSNKNIQVLVQDAFQTDKEGNVNTTRILGLRKLNIDDAKWEMAMKAIADSMHVTGTKSYIRVYQRDAQGHYQPISLDVAAVPLKAANDQSTEAA